MRRVQSNFTCATPCWSRSSTWRRRSPVVVQTSSEPDRDGNRTLWRRYRQIIPVARELIFAWTFSECSMTHPEECASAPAPGLYGAGGVGLSGDDSEAMLLSQADRKRCGNASSPRWAAAPSMTAAVTRSDTRYHGASGCYPAVMGACWRSSATPGLAARRCNAARRPLLCISMCLTTASSRAWAEFFTDLRLQNHAARELRAKSACGAVYCESRNMLFDRVVAIRETTFVPAATDATSDRQYPIARDRPDGMRLTANFALFQTMVDRPVRTLYVRSLPRSGSRRRRPPALCRARLRLQFDDRPNLTRLPGVKRRRVQALLLPASRPRGGRGMPALVSSRVAACSASWRSNIALAAALRLALNSARLSPHH